MFYTETICPDTGRKSTLLLLCCVKLGETQHANLHGHLVTLTKRKRGEHFGGVEFTLLNSFHNAKSHPWENLPERMAQIYPAQRMGSFSCQGTGSRNSHLLVHLALPCSFPGFQSRSCLVRSISALPSPGRPGMGHREGTRSCHLHGILWATLWGKQPTSVKLKWSLCRRTRNWFQLPFQLCIDRLTSVLPSNTLFPQLPHLSTAHMHWAITGTSSPLPLPKIFPSKPNHWVLMFRTAGPWLLPHWAKSASSTAPSKQMTAAVNPLASLSTWILFIVVGNVVDNCLFGRGIICVCPSDTPKGCRTQVSTSIPFFLPGQNSCIK